MFGKDITHPILILEEIKRILSIGKACYNSVQTPLFSCLLSKNLKRSEYTRLQFRLWFCMGAKLGL
jgi:hypothetical protein